jgi:hypothetical protein
MKSEKHVLFKETELIERTIFFLMLTEEQKQIVRLEPEEDKKRILVKEFMDKFIEEYKDSI